jgi:hypothetical protein
MSGRARERRHNQHTAATAIPSERKEKKDKCHPTSHPHLHQNTRGPFVRNQSFVPKSMEVRIHRRRGAALMHAWVKGGQNRTPLSIPGLRSWVRVLLHEPGTAAGRGLGRVACWAHHPQIQVPSSLHRQSTHYSLGFLPGMASGICWCRCDWDGKHHVLFEQVV